jgi:hypothetical protein
MVGDGMRKRSGKFYSNNEKEIMNLLGFKPTFASGSGDEEKEDGENDDALAQLKTTDADSFTINYLDLQKLEYHAAVAKKVPIFINQLLKHDALYVTVNVRDFPNLKNLILLRPIETKTVIEVDTDDYAEASHKIKSSSKGRDEFYKEREKQWQKKKSK